MKNIKYITLAFICGIIFSTMLSVSQSDAKKRNNNTNIEYTIPVKPLNTVYVRGTKTMYKYLSKGYQVQETAVAGSTSSKYVGFLMVKYK